MNLKTIVFIGRSGCGKGTQIRGIIDHIKKYDGRKIFYLEAGERFRSFIKEDSYSSALASKVCESGALQPAFLSTWVWCGEMVKKIEPDQHILIDGTPRRKVEAEILESAFEFYSREEVDIVYLNVSKEWAIEKMTARGRNDDKELEDILARLEWFNTDVVPVIDFYRGHRSHTFHEINGEQSIEKVQEDILKSLEI